jgi:CHAD domain-containing protein
MNGVRERELKLDAPRDFSLARMQPRLDDYSMSPVEMHRLHTVYYDAGDFRLARWGCSLRFRYGEGWTLKIPVPHDSIGLVRDEHNFPGDGTVIPAGVLDLGTAYFRGDVPVPVAELRTLRASRQVVADDGSGVASIVEDDVRVIDGTQIVNRFRQIEIELAEAAPASLLDDLGRQLRRRGAGKPDPTPKNVRALGTRSCEPELAAPVLGARSDVGDVVRAALAESVEEIVRCDVQLRVRANEDVVHRARVAVRRLRSHLRAFLPALDGRRACALRERLFWLQDGLSEARDADVFLAGMHRLGESLPDADRRTLEHVLRPCREARERAYRRVGAMLREGRYVSLLRDLVDAAKRPPLAASATGAACDAAPALVSDVWAALRKRVRRCAKPPSDRELHGIRIAAKRMRYLAEAIAPVAGSSVRRLAESAERLQTVLGEQHDAVVACERLRTIAADGERAFVAGELAAGAYAAAVDARGDWEKAWRAAKRCRRAVKASLRS